MNHTLKYIFSVPTAQEQIIMLSIFVITLILAIILNIFLAQKAQKVEPYNSLKKMVFSSLLTFGIVGLIWLFSAYEEITYLSWRFYFYLWLLSLIIYGVYVLFYILGDLRQSINRFQKQSQYQKYLPKERKNK